MTNLVAAYQARDVMAAEKILKENRATITNDPFISIFVDELLRSLRTQYIVDITKPYTRIELDYLAKVSPLPCKLLNHMLITDTQREPCRGGGSGHLSRS